MEAPTATSMIPVGEILLAILGIVVSSLLSWFLWTIKAQMKQSADMLRQTSEALQASLKDAMVLVRDQRKEDMERIGLQMDKLAEAITLVTTNSRSCREDMIERMKDKATLAEITVLHQRVDRHGEEMAQVKGLCEGVKLTLNGAESAAEKFVNAVLAKAREGKV